VSNWRTGPRRKQRPKRVVLANEETKDTRSTGSKWSLFLLLTSYLHSLRERILAAGYESADIDSIGMGALPGANVDKVLTEEGESCVTFKEIT
jgi:hypothetical protein